MYNFFIKKHNILIVLIALVAVFYIFSHYYKTPERCFVIEMNKWAMEKDFGEKIMGIRDIKNPKMAVSKAKVGVREYNLRNLDGSSREVYLKIKQLFEYCGIEY